MILSIMRLLILCKLFVCLASEGGGSPCRDVCSPEENDSGLCLRISVTEHESHVIDKEAVLSPLRLQTFLCLNKAGGSDANYTALPPSA